MAHLIQFGAHSHSAGAHCSPPGDLSRQMVWLQSITLAWTLIECGASLYGALSARSPALLAFGTDSFVELLSATVVLLGVIPSSRFPKDGAARLTGLLLFVLAGVVGVMTFASLFFFVIPETSWIGIGITVGALVVMPGLALMKRRTARLTNNRALAADAVQSATCAYLAALTLVGLAADAFFNLHWVDPVAALVAVPILIAEGRRALRGESCGCR